MNKEEAIRQYLEAQRPILDDLEDIGIDTNDIYMYLPKHIEDWKRATPVLIKWLSLVTQQDFKETLVRLLSVPWLRGHKVGKTLMEMAFDPSLNSNLRWAIGNTIEVIADDQIYHEIVELIKIESFGTSRRMFVMALGRMKNPEAVPFLVSLLQDDDVIPHALTALNKLKAVEAIEDIRKLENDSRAWVKHRAKKIVTKFEKILEKQAEKKVDK